MRHFSLVVGLTLVFSGLAIAQDANGLKKHTPKRVVVSQSPVTRAEASTTFNRLGQLFQSVLKHSVPVKSKIASSNSPVTRTEVIRELGRFYRAAEPEFKITLKPVTPDLPRITVDDPSDRKLLVKLIERGCVPMYSSLVTGKTKTLTVAQFGDDIGFFLARVSEMTHVPSVRWTPYLHGGD